MDIMHGVKLRGKATLSPHIRKWDAAIKAAVPDEERLQMLVLELGKDPMLRPVVWMILFEPDQTYLTSVQRPAESHNPADIQQVAADLFARAQQGQVGTRCDACHADYGRNVLPNICVVCDHRSISACPSCNGEFPAEAYRRYAGSILRCPGCNARVVIHAVPTQETEEGTILAHKVVVPAGYPSPMPQR